MSVVYLGLGSNTGNKFLHIESAIERLACFLSDIDFAPIYFSEPLEYIHQDDFLNTVIRGKVQLEPVDLLKMTQKVELEGGRQRSNAIEKGPRVIDIDILQYENWHTSFTLSDGQELHIPHASMHERRFVLTPLLDIEPSLRDPRDGIPWKEKVAGLSQQKLRLWN